MPYFKWSIWSNTDIVLAMIYNFETQDRWGDLPQVSMLIIDRVGTNTQVFCISG